MAGRAEKRLATLLNSCNGGNILDPARSDIISHEDHFLSDQAEEEWPESDSEDEMENVQTQDVCYIETEKEDDFVEEAVVHIEGAAGCIDAVMKWTAVVLQQKCVGKLNSGLATASRSKLWHCWMVIQDRDTLTSFPQRSVWK